MKYPHYCVNLLFLKTKCTSCLVNFNHSFYIGSITDIRYLVNKVLQAATISEDDIRSRKIVSKINSWPRSEAFRETFKFWGQPFSRGHYHPTYRKVGKGFIYFTTLRLISETRALYYGKKKQNSQWWHGVITAK